MVIRQTHGTCPYCNAVIKNYSLRAWFYGSPISTCKKCGNLYIDRRYHEMAVDDAAPDEFDGYVLHYKIFHNPDYNQMKRVEQGKRTILQRRDACPFPRGEKRAIVGKAERDLRDYSKNQQADSVAFA